MNPTQNTDTHFQNAYFSFAAEEALLRCSH